MSTDARNELAYIRELMLDTRRAASQSGGYFIVWGLAVGLALFATWLQLQGLMPYSPMITWSACFVAGILGNLYFMRQDAREPVQMPAGRLIAMVWLALGVTQLIFFYAGLGAGALPGEPLPAIFSSLIGSGLFLNGVLAGLPWLRNTAIGWWLGSLVMFIWPGDHVLLIMGALLVVFYVLPGIVLVRMKREQQVAATEV